MTTGEKLALLREKKGITQEELAEILKDCSIDISVDNCYMFIRESGYFFLAISLDSQPKLRPFGMIYSDKKALYIVTDKRKNFLLFSKYLLMKLTYFKRRICKWKN